tara:strand:- start:1102 stop:1635 length:534 start_codon:yes stop_codon:yes gene_type:complete
MANPDLVRKALMALMGAKKNNAVATGKAQPTIASPAVQAAQQNPPIASNQLRNARQNAQQVQGTDPLAQPIGPSRIPNDPPSIPGRFSDEAPTNRAFEQDRLEQSGGPNHQTEADFNDAKLELLMNTISDEAAKAGTEGVNPNLIRMLSARDPEAAKELMQSLRNQEFNPMMDDIPF